MKHNFQTNTMLMEEIKKKIIVKKGPKKRLMTAWVNLLNM